MANNANGTSDSSGPLDLDRLIGELETEAARRRAAPDFPHDADARLHFELARRAPNPPGTEAMSEIVAHVEEVASLDISAPLDVDATRSRRRGRKADLRQLQRLDARVTSLGLAAAGAFHAIAARLEQLDQRVTLLEPDADDVEIATPAVAAGDALAQWRDHLADALPRGERVLYAQADADEIVAELRSAGVDAYGVTDAGSRHRPGPDVRSADLLTHLQAVPDEALGAVVLAGGPEVLRPDAIAPLVAQLGRAAKRAVVISEAPWWWRLRIGAVDADLSSERPLDPDTWLHAFHGVARVATAAYDPSGQSYRVVMQARR
jgi:hypothetical protein